MTAWTISSSVADRSQRAAPDESVAVQLLSALAREQANDLRQVGLNLLR